MTIHPKSSRRQEVKWSRKQYSVSASLDTEVITFWDLIIVLCKSNYSKWYDIQQMLRITFIYLFIVIVQV